MQNVQKMFWKGVYQHLGATPKRWLLYNFSKNPFFTHLPFLAGMFVFSIHHLGLASMKVTASYSYEGH